METQIRRLNEEFRDLKEKLAESEEEKDTLFKKYRKLQKEKNSIQEELDDLHREFKIKQCEDDVIKQNLSDTQSKYDLQCEAMDFVTEVLTAKLDSDESVDKLYKDVDSTVDFIKDEVRDVLKQVGALSSDIDQKFFGQDLYSWAVTKKKTWIQGKKAIAFIGEFSAGKTSIVNRILSQDDPDVPLLPVSMKATTAIPTYISGGVGTFYRFVTPNNELKKISSSTFMRVNKEILDKVKGVSSLIQYFVMTYKNPYLEKMSILDTPGFNSNDFDDENRTISVINECDALFWVFDVNSGAINQTSLKVIKKHLVKPLYIIINKVDTKSKIEVDKVETLIRKTLADEGVIFKDIVRFSSKEPLDVIMKAIDGVAHDDKRESFIENLIDYLQKLLKDSADTTRKLFSDYNASRSEKGRLTKLFGFELGGLESDCDKLSEIPKYNSRVFSADDYRMTSSEYIRFKYLIEKISDERTEELRQLYGKQKEVISALETEWNKYSDAKKLQASLQKCLDRLILKVKQCSSQKVTEYNDSNDTLKFSLISPISHGNPCRIIDMNYFKKYFGASILDEIDGNLKIRWESLHSALEYHCNAKFTKKLLKELIPTYGNKRPVNKYELLRQVSYILNTSKS